MEIELSGTALKIKKRPTTLPDELREAFRKSARLEAAFKALTPGRQRAYVLHISGAKQAATRKARIAKLKPRILAGKGLNDR
ncbi:MAG: hypothetical protein FJ146_13545 [Deltaproteobacteria bacterium]|nr:hypothetical protein [Deltaproteobacteria bacterium]